MTKTTATQRASAQLRVKVACPPQDDGVNVEVRRLPEAYSFICQLTGNNADTVFERLEPGAVWVVGTQGALVVTTEKRVQLVAGQTQSVELDWLVLQRTFVP